jgi:hypothetical protein
MSDFVWGDLMRILRSIMSGDAVDLHGDRLTFEALKGMKKQTEESIIPSYYEHDYSMPQIGRIRESNIINDGKNNLLVGDIELFEVEDVNKQNPVPGKEMVIHENEKDHIVIGYDRSYEIANLTEEIVSLQKKIDISRKPRLELKKSIEPISCLTILGTAVVSGIVGGFLQKIGADIWDKIKTIFNINPRSIEEKQIIINITVEAKNGNVEAMVIVNKPDFDGIKDSLITAANIIEMRLKEYEKESVPVKKIVVCCNNNESRHEYSVYKDGTPFDIRDFEKYGRFISSSKVNIHN